MSRGHFDRHGDDPQAARAEILVLEAEVGEICSMICGGCHEAGLDVDRLRDQERLAHPAPGPKAFQQPVVDDPLVGCVLVYEHQALWPLGDEISRANLADWPQHALHRSISDPVGGGH